MIHGPIFSHSTMVMQAAIYGQGVALAYSVLAKPDIDSGRLVCPFNDVLISKNSYYIVSRESQVDIGKIVAFREWMLQTAKNEQENISDGQIQ